MLGREAGEERRARQSVEERGESDRGERAESGSQRALRALAQAPGQNPTAKASAVDVDVAAGVAGAAAAAASACQL